MAARHRIWLVAGSFVEAAGRSRNHNTSVLVGPDGTVGARYRKIHLFDVDVPGAVTRESDAVAPGDTVVSATVTLDDGRPLPIGLTICYDLRFPELYRLLSLAGALVIVVPSAFAAATGRAHWEVLVRARAIENQVFVIAADQVGELSPAVHRLRPFDDRRPLGDHPGRASRRSRPRHRRSRPGRSAGDPVPAPEPGPPPPETYGGLDRR